MTPDHISNFEAAMQSAGLTPPHIIADGKIHRFRADGTRGAKNAWYILYDDEHPAGVFGDWRADQRWTWKAHDARQLTRAERDQIKREIAARKREREAETAKAAESAMRRARNMWGRAETGTHPYATAKGIAVAGARVLGCDIIVPMYDGPSNIVNVQRIDADGNKLFLPGGKILGCYGYIGRKPTDLMLICEGWATGVSLHRATQLSVIVAFNTSNLGPVAERMRASQPDRRFIICGDNDAFTRLPDGRENPGMIKASEVSGATGIPFVVPSFGDIEEGERPTDFNDLHKTRGMAEVNRQVMQALRPDRPASAIQTTLKQTQQVKPEAQVYSLRTRAPMPPGDQWREQLIFKTDDIPEPKVLANGVAFLSHHPKIGGTFRRNLFTHAVEIHPHDDQRWTGKQVRPAVDQDTTHATAWLEHHGMRLSAAQVDRCVEIAADNHGYHPVLDYLDGLKWDGRERLPTWLCYYMGAEQSEYTRAVGLRFMVGAVARIVDPGSKVDTMLILEGPQGVRKSTAVAALFGREWFTDQLAKLGTNDASQSVMGKWGVEVAEMNRMTGADYAVVKEFLSRSSDYFRMPYGRRFVTAQRSCVFVGTINPEGGYLRDPTGNRRYWPVSVTAIDVESIEHDRDQLWAEALQLYRAREPWWLQGDEVTLQEVEAAKRFEGDPWADLIDPYLRGKTQVTVTDILKDVLMIEPGRRDRSAEMRVAKVLVSMGWTSGGRVRIGGAQVRLWAPATA